MSNKTLNRHRWVVRAIQAAVFVLVLDACGVLASGARRDSRSDVAAIRTQMTESAAAWNRGDLKGHLAIYADSVTFMTQTGPRTGVKPIEEAFARKYFNNGRPKQSLSFSEIVIRLPARDVALLTGRFILSGGGEPDQSGHFSLVWTRTNDGRWRAIHDHSS